MTSTKNDKFCEPQSPQSTKINKRSIINKNIRICKHMTNVKSPQPLFPVDAINVWSQSINTTHRINFFKRCFEQYVLSYLISIFC